MSDYLAAEEMAAELAKNACKKWLEFRLARDPDLTEHGLFQMLNSEILADLQMYLVHEVYTDFMENHPELD